MAVSPNTKASLRKTLSILLLAGLLAFLLVLYFLKYVPDQRRDFHRRAFLELSQIDRALQTRNKAYLDVIRNSVDSLPADSIPNALQRYNFTYETFRRYDTIRKLRPNDTLVYQRIRFDQKKIMGNWELAYLLSEKNNDTAVAKLSKDLDSILNPLASTYRDIFSDYLLILDTSTNLTPESPGPQNAYNHKGRVVFNSGRLSVDFLVNMDTLLKKTDGFSLLNIHDVKIEGNPYKLFLYPILLCNQRVILAGLISESRYREGSESVPIDMLTIGGLILLLLLLNLPILKMYIIGPMERITEMDIRLIIATYFVAAFVIFFLFSSCFLTQIQNSTSRTSLEKLSAAIRDSVYSEIRKENEQLKYYDRKYADLHLHYSTAVSIGMLGLLDSQTPPEQSSLYADTLNRLFHPESYPRMNIVFWIDETGDWVGSWAFEKRSRRAHRVKVADRQYFKDIIRGENLSLPGVDFAIQPTLSRVTGEYNVNLVIKSGYDTFKRTVYSPGGDSITTKMPAMLGLASEMYSLQNTVLPPGYTFSIVDENGDIQFDARPGRSLLSNIFIEAGENTDIEKCVRYRYDRFFPHFSLRGREVALLSKPMPYTNYTLLVYYNLGPLQDFHLHSLGLCCFCIACILALITLIAFINEWAKKRPNLLRISRITFDWLRPVPSKINYYRSLLASMGALFGIFVFAWLLIEIARPDAEPALLLISLSFPFFVAANYYILRERYYFLDMGQRSSQLIVRPRRHRQFVSLLQLPALQILGIILLSILIYVFTAGLTGLVIFCTLLFQLLFAGVIRFFRLRLKELRYSWNLDHLLRRYTATILIGIFLITLVPASALFLLFFKEENTSILRMQTLSMAGKIKVRAHQINNKNLEYGFTNNDSSYLGNSKFRYGIYFTNAMDIFPGVPNLTAVRSYSGFGSLHDFLFAPDSISLEATAKNDNAGDNSWHFGLMGPSKNLILAYYNPARKDTKDAFFLSADPRVGFSALGLFFDQLGSLDALTVCLAVLAIGIAILVAWCLMSSLTSHIFLLKLLRKYRAIPYRQRPAADQARCEELQKPGEPLSSLACKEFILKYENQTAMDILVDEKSVLQTQVELELLYDKIWKEIPTEEKYILYDFALDGFTNHKAGVLIYKLMYRGLLRVDENLRLRIRSQNFYNYLLSKDIFNQYLSNEDDKPVYLYMKNVQKQGSWQAFRLPLQIVVGIIGLFIFFTQEALYQKVLGLFTSLPFLMQLLATFFERSGAQPDSGTSQHHTHTDTSEIALKSDI